MVFYTIIEVQVVFEMFFVLITGQLAISGQLGSDVHPQRIGLFLRI